MMFCCPWVLDTAHKQINPRSKGIAWQKPLYEISGNQNNSEGLWRLK